MSLLNLRGGQPYYLTYKASPYENLKSPAGVQSFITLNTPKVSSKTSSKDKEDKDHKILFPGTVGSRNMAYQLANQLKSAYSNTKSSINSKLRTHLKNGGTKESFIKSGEVNQEIQQLQNYEQSFYELSNIRPDMNEDANHIEAGKNQMMAENMGGAIATKNNGAGFYTPFSGRGIETYNDYFINEENDKTKIQRDPNSGLLTYKQTYVPSSYDYMGSFSAKTTKMFGQAMQAFSQSGSSSPQGFNMDPNNPYAFIVHEVHRKVGSNHKSINDAVISLSAQLTDKEKQDIDGIFWSNASSGDIYTYDFSGNTRTRRKIGTDKNYEDEDKIILDALQKYATNNYADENEKTKVFDIVNTLMSYNRFMELELQSEAYKKISRDMTIGGRMWGGKEKKDTQIGMGLTQSILSGRTPDNMDINGNLERRQTIAMVKDRDGKLFSLNFTGKVIVDPTDPNVQGDNQVYRTNLASGNGTNALMEGNVWINSKTGQYIPLSVMSKGRIKQKTGYFSEINPGFYNSSTGEYEYATSVGGGTMLDDRQLAYMIKDTPELSQLYEANYIQSGKDSKKAFDMTLAQMQDKYPNILTGVTWGTGYDIEIPYTNDNVTDIMREFGEIYGTSSQVLDDKEKLSNVGITFDKVNYGDKDDKFENVITIHNAMTPMMQTEGFQDEIMNTSGNQERIRELDVETKKREYPNTPVLQKSAL